MGTHASKPTFSSSKPRTGSTHSPKAVVSTAPLSSGSTHSPKAYGTNPMSKGSNGTNNQKGSK